MMDDLQQAYNAYQTALVHLPNPKVGSSLLRPMTSLLTRAKIQEPRLWYGIGILYDRYGSLDHAEDAFAQVMKMQPDFDKAHEIYFRLGIIYKQQQKYNESLEVRQRAIPTHLERADQLLCSVSSTSSTRLLHPSPRRISGSKSVTSMSSRKTYVHPTILAAVAMLTPTQFENAKAAYHRVLDRDPNHAKVLQQLGWLHHTQSQHFDSQERAIEYLEKSVAAGGFSLLRSFLGAP
jgi:tetratricopeptide (TPR) repeat protein